MKLILDSKNNTLHVQTELGDAEDTLQRFANLLYNSKATDDTRDLDSKAHSFTVRSNRNRLVKGLLIARYEEKRTELGRTPRVLNVCAEIAHFLQGNLIEV